MKEVFPGIFLETAYPPYNLVLIDTSHGVIAIDIPPRPVHAVNWLEQARSALGEIRYAIMTDASPERQMATAFWDVPIIATETTLRLMEAYDEDRERRSFIEDLTARYEDELNLIEHVEPRKPTLAFDETFRLYTDDRYLELSTSEGGAAPGSLWVFVPDQSLLITGDTVAVEDPPPLDLTPDSKAWLNSLGLIAHRRSVEHIIPGRGSGPITQEEIEPHRELMRVLRRSARKLAHGTSELDLAETAQDLGQTFFKGHGQVAVKRLQAGLEHLVAEVESEESSDDEESEDNGD
jgi:glyoxylase-like metal-dependent hydrolase (beta-lactamase superfamily II)